MKRIVPLLCLLVAGALSSTALARSPEETLVAYVNAVQRDGLAAAVQFIHADELASFRTKIEPEIEKRIKNSRTRERFMTFIDPYNKKQLRPFKDDAEFVSVFIKWIGKSGIAAVSTFDNATVKPLGYVIENDLRHVVARFEFLVPNQEKVGETVSVTSMRMQNGQPMLLLLPELKQFVDMIRGLR